MRSSTLYFCADKTNIYLDTMMRQVFCNLRGCALAPLHLAFAVADSSWGKRTEISTQVRKILAKFSPCRFGKASGDKFYRGEPIKGDREKQRRMKQISREGADSKAALRKIMSIDTTTGFKSRSEFCNYIVSAAQAYPSCVRKKTRTARRIGDLMCASCDPETIEWHLNNERIRKEIDPSIREYMAVGTTGSEALNAELKHWFSGINQLRAPTMRLKLRVFQLSKLIAFSSAMYERTSVQIRQCMVLARVLKNWSICEADAWRIWCLAQNVYALPLRRPVMSRRFAGADLLATWKKDKRSTNPKERRKRRPTKVTPYTQNKGNVNNRKTQDRIPTE